MPVVGVTRRVRCAELLVHVMVHAEGGSTRFRLSLGIGAVNIWQLSTLPRM